MGKADGVEALVGRIMMIYSDYAHAKLCTDDPNCKHPAHRDEAIRARIAREEAERLERERLHREGAAVGRVADCSERCPEGTGCLSDAAKRMLGKVPFEATPEPERSRLAACPDCNGTHCPVEAKPGTAMVIVRYWHPQGSSPYMVLRCPACGHTENGGAL